MNYETDIAERLAAGKNAATIAAEINAQRRAAEISQRRLSYLGLSNLLNVAIMRRLIATIDAVAAADGLVAEVREFLRADSGVDVGNPVTRAMLDEFAANEQLPLTADDATAIKNLAYLGRLETVETVQAAIDEWNSIVSKWLRLYTLGDAYARQNPEATLQQVFDAVSGGV